MQRTMQAVLIGLIMVIGLTAGSMAWRVASTPPIAPDRQTTDPAIGYAFYRALDEVLATGDHAALYSVVSGGFVDHDGAQKASAGELVDELLSVRASFPSLRYQVRDIQSTDSALIASIAPAQLAGTMLDGMRISTHRMPGGFEVLRIQGGKVTERWASQLPDARVDSFDSAGLQVDGAFSNTIRLEKIELPADGSFRWRAFGDRVILVKEGTLQLDSHRIDPSGEPLQDSQSLEAGQAIASQSGTIVTARAGGLKPASAVVLLLTLQQVKPADTTMISLGPGVKLELLWQSNLAMLPDGSWKLSFAQMTLPAGMTAELSGDLPSTLLLSGDGGPSRISIVSGELSTFDGAYVPVSAGSSTSLGAGTAALVEQTAAMEIGNTGNQPATLWLIRIRSGDSRATPEGF